MIRKYSRLMLGLFAISSTVQVSVAGEVEKFYQVESKLSYQSNPGFLDKDKSSVFALKIKPSAQIKYADELNQYNLNVGLGIYKNSNEKVLLDYIAPEIVADWSRELEFGKIGLEATYNEVAARAEALRLNGTNIDVENVTKRAGIKGIFNFEFNDRFSVNNSLGYQNVKYSEKAGGFNDYRVLEAGSQLVYKKSDRFSTYAEVEYSDLNPSSGGGAENSDVYALLAGGIYTPSEDIKVELAVGGYDASGRFDDSGLRLKSNASYSYNRMTLNFNADRGMFAGGNGIYQLGETINVGGVYQMSENSDISTRYVWSKTSPDREVSSFDVIYDALSIAYGRRYEDWRASVYVDFIGLDLDGDQRRQSVIGLMVSFDPFDFNDSRRNPLTF
jgi:hypothetical protein